MLPPVKLYFRVQKAWSRAQVLCTAFPPQEPALLRLPSCAVPPRILRLSVKAYDRDILHPTPVAVSRGETSRTKELCASEQQSWSSRCVRRLLLISDYHCDKILMIKTYTFRLWPRSPAWLFRFPVTRSPPAAAAPDIGRGRRVAVAGLLDPPATRGGRAVRPRLACSEAPPSLLVREGVCGGVQGYCEYFAKISRVLC